MTQKIEGQILSLYFWVYSYPQLGKRENDIWESSLEVENETILYVVKSHPAQTSIDQVRLPFANHLPSLLLKTANKAAWGQTFASFNSSPPL